LASPGRIVNCAFAISAVRISFFGGCFADQSIFERSVAAPFVV
jgi:hypothetical protein